MLRGVHHQKSRQKQSGNLASGDLRYSRLRDLLSLVHMMQGSATGVSLPDIAAEFGVSRRTAERMRDAVVEAFIQVEELRLDDGSKRWRLKERILTPATSVKTDDLAALQIVEEFLGREGQSSLGGSVARMRQALLTTLAWRDLLRREPDMEVVSEAEGIANRPGPREKTDPDIIATLRNAIKRCAVVRLLHWTENAKKSSRSHEVEPLGLLYATGRTYLVGRSQQHGKVHLFRLGRIEHVKIIEKTFERPKRFEIRNYARNSFGVFQEKPVEIVWKFRSDVANEARSFLFHHSQKFKSQKDGSVMVSFRAGGLREMCWHLFTWGDAVEIIRPPQLKALYIDLLTTARRTADTRRSSEKVYKKNEE